MYFPSELNKFFPNLEVIKIWDSKLKFIDNFDMRWLSKLRILNLEDNQIEVLQPELFNHNAQLTELHLKKNKLKFIGARILVPLTRLEIANFMENICVDSSAESPTALDALRRHLDDNCAAPEFLVKRNSEFIKKFVELNFTIADMTETNEKLEVDLNTKSQSLVTCESENEELNSAKFKVEMKLRKESSALKKAKNELATTKVSNDDLTVENVKLNNELKRSILKIAETEERVKDSLFSNRTTESCSDGSADFHKLKFEKAKLEKENERLKSFKEEIEKEWRALNLECEFVAWDGYTCQTSSLKISADDSEIVKVDGKHDGRKTNFDVKNFAIASQDFRTTFLPNNIGSIFPKLQSLLVQGSKLVFIKRGNFDNLLSLQNLILDHNQIEEIPAEAFDDLENLVRLDVSFNKLLTVDRDSFNGVKKLKILALNDNKIEKLSASIFRFNLALEFIALQNNHIKYIGCSMLKHLKKLKFVNFKMNDCIDLQFTEDSVSQIDTRILSHCTPPTDVYCSFEASYLCKVVELLIENENTQIQEIIGNHHKGKSNDNVNELSIVDQSIASFPVGFGRFFKNLKKILVRNSKLTSVDDNSFQSLQVTHLILANNEIVHVSSEAFQKLKSSLEAIDLSHNKISQLDTTTFNYLLKLKVLNLGHNKLQKLNGNIFVHNVNLEQLYLDNNKLKSINAYLMNNLRILKLADFTGNTCINMNFPRNTLQNLKLKILEQCK